MDQEDFIGAEAESFWLFREDAGDRVVGARWQLAERAGWSRDWYLDQESRRTLHTFLLGRSDLEAQLDQLIADDQDAQVRWVEALTEAFAPAVGEGPEEEREEEEESRTGEEPEAAVTSDEDHSQTEEEAPAPRLSIFGNKASAPEPAPEPAAAAPSSLFASRPAPEPAAADAPAPSGQTSPEEAEEEAEAGQEAEAEEEAEELLIEEELEPADDSLASEEVAALTQLASDPGTVLQPADVAIIASEPQASAKLKAADDEVETLVSGADAGFDFDDEDEEDEDEDFEASNA